MLLGGAGTSYSRLLLILAVLQKSYDISFYKRDVYVNVVGGMHLGNGGRGGPKGGGGGGGSDLAVAVSVVSSLLGIPVRSDTAFVGEVGLLGELRPVAGAFVGKADKRGPEDEILEDRYSIITHRSCWGQEEKGERFGTEGDLVKYSSLRLTLEMFIDTECDTGVLGDHQSHRGRTGQDLIYLIRITIWFICTIVSC